MGATVNKGQRFTAERPCPICGGYDRMPRGKGIRCNGYLGHDGLYAHCSREELAGGLHAEDLGTYAHKLDGPCKCGETHGDAPAASSMPPTRALARTNGTHAQKPDLPFREVARWEYEGGLVVVRAENAAGKKVYWQRRRLADGTEANGLGDTPRTLYRVSEVRAAARSQWIWFVEGEKCADALRSIGLVATTTPQGAKSFKLSAEHAVDVLRHRHVVMLPDHDDDGASFATAVRESLERVAASFRILDLPGLDAGEDVYDWLQRGGDAEELVRLAEACPDLTAPFRTLRAAEAARRLWGEPLPPALPTGVAGLDKVIVGLRAESLLILQGPTGRGKTGLAVQVSRHLSRSDGGRELVYLSSELSARQVLARFAAQVRCVPWVRMYELGPSEVEHIVSDLAGLSLRVVELRRGMAIRDVLKRVADEVGQAPIMVLDYLQHAARRLAIEDPRRAVGQLVDELADWTRETRSTGLILGAVGRGHYKPDEGTTAEDLVSAGKEAGEIEYDASAVLFLQAELPPEGGASPAKLHVSKHRFGPSGGTIGLRFNGAVGMFHDDPTCALSELDIRCYQAISAGAQTQEDVREKVKAGKPRVRASLRVLEALELITSVPYRIRSNLP